MEWLSFPPQLLFSQISDYSFSLSFLQQASLCPPVWCLCFAVCLCPPTLLSLSLFPQRLPVLPCSVLLVRRCLHCSSKASLKLCFFQHSKLFSHLPCKELEMWSDKRNCSWVMELIQPGFLPESSIYWMPPLFSQTDLPSSLPALCPLHMSPH